MERPLAHLLPEMTANLLAPMCILVYLFILDWRMALLSLVSIPVGMAFMMAVMKNYGKQYEGSVKVNQAMNSTIVEYIGGIEVIKAFNQGKKFLCQIFRTCEGKCVLFLPLDEELSDACLHFPRPCSYHIDHNSAGRMADVPSRNFISRDFYHDHDPFIGDCRSAAGSYGFRGQPGKGRDHCWRSRFYFKQRGTASCQPGGPADRQGYLCGRGFFRLP